MQYGLDVLNPPTREWSFMATELGWKWLNVYVGGPRASARTSWHQIDGVRHPVRDIAAVWRGFLPTYVGRNFPWDSADAFTYEQGLIDGDDANENTGACGFDSWTPLCLDIEYGTWQNYGDAVTQYV